jgi:chromosome segregation ATPase
MSGAIGCIHLRRDADGSCPECREATERMQRMVQEIPVARRLSPWEAADLRAALSASEARAADLDRKLTTAMRAGVAMSEAHEAALARVAASEARATAAEEHSRGLESALQIMGEENAKIERERDEALSLGERQDKALMRCQSERDEARRALREVLDEIGEINGWRPTALQPGGVLYDRARALSGAGAEEGR